MSNLSPQQFAVYDFSQDAPVKERHAVPPSTHKQRVSDYYDSRDAWDARREMNHQMEPDEFREHDKPPTWKGWLKGA